MYINNDQLNEMFGKLSNVYQTKTPEEIVEKINTIFKYDDVMKCSVELVRDNKDFFIKERGELYSTKDTVILEYCHIDREEFKHTLRDWGITLTTKYKRKKYTSCMYID